MFDDVSELDGFETGVIEGVNEVKTYISCNKCFSKVHEDHNNCVRCGSALETGKSFDFRYYIFNKSILETVSPELYFRFRMEFAEENNQRRIFTGFKRTFPNISATNEDEVEDELNAMVEGKKARIGYKNNAKKDEAENRVIHKFDFI